LSRYPHLARFLTGAEHTFYWRLTVPESLRFFCACRLRQWSGSAQLYNTRKGKLRAV
jgi:hypothetical protein